MNSGPEVVTSADGEGEVEVVKHWGCQFVRPDGTVYITRWDPSYGSGINVPYTEEEARVDVASPSPDFNGTKRLVSRTQTTLTVTTPWKEES